MVYLRYNDQIKRIMNEEERKKKNPTSESKDLLNKLSSKKVNDQINENSPDKHNYHQKNLCPDDANDMNNIDIEDLEKISEKSVENGASSEEYNIYYHNDSSDSIFGESPPKINRNSMEKKYIKEIEGEQNSLNLIINSNDEQQKKNEANYFANKASPSQNIHEAIFSKEIDGEIRLKQNDSLDKAKENEIEKYIDKNILEQSKPSISIKNSNTAAIEMQSFNRQENKEIGERSNEKIINNYVNYTHSENKANEDKDNSNIDNNNNLQLFKSKTNQSNKNIKSFQSDSYNEEHGKLILDNQCIFEEEKKQLYINHDKITQSYNLSTREVDNERKGEKVYQENNDQNSHDININNKKSQIEDKSADDIGNNFFKKILGNEQNPLKININNKSPKIIKLKDFKRLIRFNPFRQRRVDNKFIRYRTRSNQLALKKKQHKNASQLVLRGKNSENSNNFNFNQMNKETKSRHCENLTLDDFIENYRKKINGKFNKKIEEILKFFHSIEVNFDDLPLTENPIKLLKKLTEINNVFERNEVIDKIDIIVNNL